MRFTDDCELGFSRTKSNQISRRHEHDLLILRVAHIFCDNFLPRAQEDQNHVATSPSSARRPYTRRREREMPIFLILFIITPIRDSN